MIAILEEAGSGMNRVVTTSVFMTDLNEFSKMNEIYAGTSKNIHLEERLSR
jgi:2-iminobutanoate/2-iminopropanoate deaminase